MGDGTPCQLRTVFLPKKTLHRVDPHVPGPGGSCPTTLSAVTKLQFSLQAAPPPPPPLRRAMSDSVFDRLQISRALKGIGNLLGIREPSSWRKGGRPLQNAIGQDWTTKLNVVCLHGRDQNADRLKRMAGMGRIEERCRSIANFTYVSAPHSSGGSSRVWFTPALRERQWGFRESLARVVDVGADAHVVLGYSMGGMMSANIVGREAVRGQFPSLLGAIFVHSPDFMGFDATDFVRLGGGAKTLHIIGDNDGVVQPSDSAKLCKRFTHHEESHHTRGHDMSSIPASTVEHVYRFLDSLRQQLLALECLTHLL